MKAEEGAVTAVPAGDDALRGVPPGAQPSLGKLLRVSSLVRETAESVRFLRATRYGLYPLVALTFVDFMQAFDNSIAGLVLPEVRRHFGVRLTVLGVIGTTVGFFTLFSGPVIGFVADRVRRTVMVGMSTVLSGVFSMLTGASPSYLAFAGIRAVDEVGERVGDIPTQSLLNDYYPVEARGKAYALRTLALRLAGLTGPVTVGYLATRFGWRAPFVVVGPVLILSGLVLVRLREPVRGFWERLRLGLDERAAEEREPPIGWGEAVRTILAVRTLRRVMIALPLLGGAGAAFELLYGFYLLEKFHLSPFERSLIRVPAAIVSLLAVVIGGVVTDRLIRHRPGRVLLFNGMLAVVSAVSHLLVVVVPNLGLLIVFSVLITMASGVVQPAVTVAGALVLPPRLRGQGIGTVALFAAPAIFAPPIAFYVAERYGLQTGMLLFAPMYLAAAGLAASAGSFFELDMRSAIAQAAAYQEYRRAKESGQTKLLVCRGVDVHYGSVQVLFGVDFDVEEGETIALLGTNGAGKSTLLRAISGIQEASGGAIVFDGRDITHVPPHEIARMGIVHMPGGRGVFPGLTVRENLEVAIANLPDPQRGRHRLSQVFGYFPRLRERLDTQAGSLSGGEQQMLALAQAFLAEPKLLVIDELSLGLAPQVVQELLGIVRAMNAQGTTIILVEQSVNVALTVAERAIFMEKGEVKFVGRTRDLLARPDIMRAVYLKGAAALTEAPARPRPARAERARRGRAILAVEGLSKSFGGVRAVHGVTFELREGEVLGVIGPNGAGKTTLFDLISGLLSPDSGRVVFDGVDVTRLGPDARAKARLVRRFQDAHLFPSLTVFETVCVALERKLEVRNTFLAALQVPAARRGEVRVRKRAERLIEILELEAFRDKFVSELSTGVRRVVDLACVLAAEPRVLLLDEPSSGIAQAEAEGLAPLLRRVRFETGCSMLVIEHDMPLIASVADELLAMVQGAVVARGKPEEVLNHPVVVEAYLGSSEEALRRSGALPR